MPMTLDKLKEKAQEIEDQEVYGDEIEEQGDKVQEENPLEELNPESKEEVSEESTQENTEEVPENLENEEQGDQPEFSFDPKIKVMDQEYEVPEFLAKSVENEEQAKELKDMFEKAYGLDAVKEKRDHFKTKASDFEQKATEYKSELEKTNENLDFLDGLIKKGDMHTFQQHAGITDEAVLKRAAEIIQYRELTPQQKAEYDNNIQSRQRLYAMEFENKDLRQSHSKNEYQETHNALDGLLSDDSFGSIAKEFDGRMGYGAFKNEVVKRAVFIEQTEGKSLSPEEAVNEVVKIYNLQPRQVQEQVIEQQKEVPVEQKVVVRNKPTIPKVESGSKSPVKKVPRSIDDLRAMADKFDY